MHTGMTCIHTFHTFYITIHNAHIYNYVYIACMHYITYTCTALHAHTALHTTYIRYMHAYIILHDITLRYITLHYIYTHIYIYTLHTLQNLPYITFTRHYMSMMYIKYVTCIHYIALHDISMTWIHYARRHTTLHAYVTSHASVHTPHTTSHTLHVYMTYLTHANLN